MNIKNCVKKCVSIITFFLVFTFLFCAPLAHAKCNSNIELPIEFKKTETTSSKSKKEEPKKFSSLEEAMNFFLDYNAESISYRTGLFYLEKVEIPKSDYEEIRMFMKTDLFNDKFIANATSCIAMDSNEILDVLNDNIKDGVDGLKNNELLWTILEQIVIEIHKKLEDGTKVYDTSYQETTDISSSESIATGDMYAPNKAKKDSGIGYEQGADDLEAAIAGLLSGLGDSINDLVGTCNGTLDRLVYGRLVYYGTNFYSFELVKGNPYGIVGSYVYKLFRNLVIPILILLIFSKFAKAAWNSGNGEQRRIFKDTIARTALMLLLVFLVPNIIDVLIALRDVVLHYVSDNLSVNMTSFFELENSGTADTSNSIVGYYKVATDGGHLLDALLYLGVSFISVFYMVTYISTAVSVMVSFMFFPLIVIFSFTENKMIDMWFKELIGNVFVPVLDAVLLLMPLMLNQFLPNSGAKAYLISFIACYSVIPSRAVIRGMLGVGGNIRSELLGFGALMGTMRMLSGIKNRVAGGVKGLWGAHKQNKADREMADMYADLARANGEGDQLTGRFASLGRLSST